MLIDVELNKVTKSFGKDRGIYDINIEVERNTKTLLLGPNGAGKTTILYLIYGILRPDSGYIKILGREPNIEMRKNDVYMLEELLIFIERATVREFIDFVKSLRYFNDQLFDLIDTFNINTNLKVYQLSSGLRRLLKISLALSSGAKVLLLDEPTSNLDIDNSKKVFSLIQQYDGTVIFASHDPEAINAAESIVHIRNGKLEYTEKRNKN
ncbi:ATP-binding cassette domain-containing protein [Acidianus brierleyi]|uniref:ABC transporter ATP-binding protein n=1 Tax=Acidianus brierleyi TaxID=41673 RepID=A0A2U9IGT1_9CREN|nr:ATP-binding cassette domain-containing protein [Acidianus brierleyi]